MLIAAPLDLFKMQTTFVSAIKIVLLAQALIITTVIAALMVRRKTVQVF